MYCIHTEYIDACTCICTVHVMVKFPFRVVTVPFSFFPFAVHYAFLLAVGLLKIRLDTL